MENKLSIKERILAIADFKGVNRSDFPEKLGMTYGNFKGKQSKTPINSNVLDTLLSIYPDINPLWLLTGKEDMIKEESKEGNPALRHVSNLPSSTNVIEINPKTSKSNTLIADVHASAGFGSLMESNKGIEDLPAIHIPDAPHGLNIAFQINGDSMYPTIRHLDYIVGNQITNIENIRDGHVYIIVDKDDGVICKRVYKLGADWQIVSDNPIYKPYNRDKSQILYFFKAFCRWSYDFRNYHDDLRADVQQLKSEFAILKAKNNK